MDHADIVVIGAGIAGASAAYELALEASVLLLEREDRPGYHSTGRSAAVFAPVYGNQPIRRLTAASEAFYQDRAGGLADQPVLTPRGELLIARQNQIATLDKAEAVLTPALPGLKRLSAEAAIARVPALRSGYIAAALADHSAMDMDVAAIHQGFLNGFRKRGGRLMVDAEVSALTARADRRVGFDVLSKAGSFSADIVVNAAGAWADEIAALAGAAPIDLVPKRRTAFIFDPEAVVDSTWPVVCDIDETFYFKPESGLLLGSPADETPLPPVDVQPEDLDVAIAVDRIEKATDWRVKRVARKWAGLRSFVADKTPVVGMDGLKPGFFWLAAQGGYGIQTAPAIAKVAAALINERDLPDDILATGLRAADLAPTRLS